MGWDSQETNAPHENMEMKNASTTCSQGGKPPSSQARTASKAAMARVRGILFVRADRKTGPNFVKIRGQAVRYPMNDVLAYESQWK